MDQNGTTTQVWGTFPHGGTIFQKDRVKVTMKTETEE
jgi:hypothetical protein